MAKKETNETNTESGKKAGKKAGKMAENNAGKIIGKKTGKKLTRLEQKTFGVIQAFFTEHDESPTMAEIGELLGIKSRGTVHRYVQSLIKKGYLERSGGGWRGLQLPAESASRSESNEPGNQIGHESSHPSIDKTIDKTTDKVFNMTAAQQQSSTSQSPQSALPGNQSNVSPLRPPGARHVGKRKRTDRLAGSAVAPSDLAEPVFDSAEFEVVTVSGDDSANDFRIPLAGQIAAGMPLEALPDDAHLDLSGFFVGRDRYALRVTGDSMVNAGILDGDTVIIRKQAKARSGDIVVALIDQQEATLKRLGKYTSAEVELVPENDEMPIMLYSAARISIQGVLIGQIRCY